MRDQAYFIGGPRDLSKMYLREAHPYMEFAELHTFKSWEAPQNKDALQVKRHRYRRMPDVRNRDNESFCIYIYDGVVG